MKQRGRKSAAELAVVTPFRARLLEPSPDLSPDEASIWGKVVATKPGEWWDAGSLPLLSQYCRASVQADLIGELVRKVGDAMLTDPDELGRYKELRKIQATLSSELSALATKMRLTQQSRYNAKNSDTSARKANGRKPWQHDVIEG